MTSIPRESVPSLPRHEVSERPLLEGTAGRGGADFEDFLFSLADPAAQAFFRARPKPEPASSTRSDESRESDSRSTGRTEKRSENRGDESQTKEDSAAVLKTEDSRRTHLSDGSLLPEEIATDPNLIAAAWPTIAVEPETISDVAEETGEELIDGVSLVATPTVLLPIQTVAAEVGEEPAAVPAVPLEAQPIDEAFEQVAVLKPLSPASPRQVNEASSVSPVFAQREEVTASPVRTLEQQAIEVAEAVVPTELEVKVAAVPAATASLSRAASAAVTAATAEVVDPAGETAEEVSPDERSHRSSGTISLAELAPSLYAESLNEIPLTEKNVEKSEPTSVLPAEVSPNLTRDSQAAPAAVTPASAMVTPTSQTQLAVPTPTPPPSPSMATPPSIACATMRGISRAVALKHLAGCGATNRTWVLRL